LAILLKSSPRLIGGSGKFLERLAIILVKPIASPVRGAMAGCAIEAAAIPDWKGKDSSAKRQKEGGRRQKVERLIRLSFGSVVNWSLISAMLH
jgi:hypothetical protein